MRDRIYHCDGPECRTHQQSTASPPLIGWLLVFTEGRELDFCCWECAIRYGATTPPIEVIPWQ